MASRDIAIDVVAALAGVAASWLVGDAILRAASKKKPLVLEPRNFEEHFSGDDRVAGGFHLAMGLYDGMHLGYHVVHCIQKPQRRTYHALQALFSTVRLGYHTLWSYRRHYKAYTR